ncbi:hypothetical protein B0A64_18160 [Flavobacterium araucananum]|uniref:Uncharacterized protein n=1 Tax=Flavobacterium araucananum TaxID=946678 RepID=A0A227P0Z9_9FLAO|nr:hypothetical protein B0A64_18160 [Flavobacterium araucananum]
MATFFSQVIIHVIRGKKRISENLCNSWPKKILLRFGTMALTKLKSKLITFVEIDFFYAN